MILLIVVRIRRISTKWMYDNWHRKNHISIKISKSWFGNEMVLSHYTAYVILH